MLRKKGVRPLFGERREKRGQTPLLMAWVVGLAVWVPALDVQVPSMGSAAPDKPYLVVSAEIASARRVRYCFDVDAAFKPDLLARMMLMRSP